MVWLACTELPQWSVAVQVRVTLTNCGHAPGVITSANVKVGAGSHTSVAVGSLNTGLAGLVLPQWSVAVQVRVTLRLCPHAPGETTSANVNVGFGSHRSLAVGSLNTSGAEHSMVRGPPTPAIVGAVLSSTVIVWLAVL